MKQIPVYICNMKKCLGCVGAICGRTIDKDYAALDENGHPEIDSYISFEDLGDTSSRFKEAESRFCTYATKSGFCSFYRV